MLPCFSRRRDYRSPVLAKIALPEQFRPPNMPKTPLKLPYTPNREGDFAVGGRFGRSLTQLSKTAGCDFDAYDRALMQLSSTPS